MQIFNLFRLFLFGELLLETEALFDDFFLPFIFARKDDDSDLIDREFANKLRISIVKDGRHIKILMCLY